MEMNMEEEKVKGIVPVLACVLHQLCVANDDLSFDPKKAVSKFHALCIPTLGIRGYLERIAKYSGCSPECFVLCLVYIDRIIQSRGFIVNSYSIHRLLITGTMMAAKFFDDHYYNNAYYAKVGGVNAEEMNSLEVEFLFMLNFHLFVSTRTYKLYYQELFAHTNNPKAVCGCTGAKVPPLVFPFPSTPDEKSKLPDTSTDPTDNEGPDLSIDDDDDDDGYEDNDDPEHADSQLPDSKQPQKDSKYNDDGSENKLRSTSENKLRSTSSMETDTHHQTTIIPEKKQQQQSQQQPVQQSQQHQQHQHQHPVSKTIPSSTTQTTQTTTQTTGGTSREVLGWQSPLRRPPDSDKDEVMTDASPPHRSSHRHHKSMDISSTTTNRPLPTSHSSEEMRMSDSPVSKSRSVSSTHQPSIPISTVQQQHHHHHQTLGTSLPPERVVERVGRKASDYSAAPLTRSSTLTLKQTQFWRLQQSLQPHQGGHVLVPTGGIPLQKSASATLPQSSSFQPPPAQQQPQQQQQQQQNSHRLRRGMSSVQSVTVR